MKYNDSDITKSILLIIDNGLTVQDVADQTGISKRTLQRHLSKYVKGIPATTDKDIVTAEEKVAVRKPKGYDPVVKNALDKAIMDRAEFLEEIFETKKVLLARMKKLGKNSDNLDAIQKSIKTLTEIEQAVAPEGGNTPAVNAKTVNMFQFFNQQLIEKGYEGPELTDADIVKGD